MPLEAPEEYIEPYKGGDKKRAIYSGMVAVMDEAIGNITNHLKERNLWDNSLIVFTTDNGGQAYAGGSNLPYRGNKGSYWEGGIKGVGFITGGAAKDLVPFGGEYNHLFHISDWMPTLLDAVGCSKGPRDLDGLRNRSFIIESCFLSEFVLSLRIF